MYPGPHYVVVLVDGPDPDNFVAALVASCKLLGMDVVAVIMTGRPVSSKADARPFDNMPRAARAVLRDNALHMRGVLLRHDRGHIPVFCGGRAPYSTVPHNMHVRERVTDIYDDAHAGHELAGDIDDAVAYLAKLPGTLHFVCGGPLTDLMYLMSQPMLHGRLGCATAQFGMFGSPRVKVLAGGRRQFNVLADAYAAHNVLRGYPGQLCMVPTDITKLPEHGFAGPEALEKLVTSTAFKEVVQMYEGWCGWRGNLAGQIIHVHDFHPALLMSLLLQRGGDMLSVCGEQLGPYRISPVGIKHVPHGEDEMDRWGEIDLRPAPKKRPRRFLVTDVDTGSHARLLADALNSPAG